MYDQNGVLPANEKMRGFSEIGQDLQLVLEKLITNENLCKLLYYNGKDSLAQPDIDADTKLSMINDYIKVVPVIPKDVQEKNYIIVQFSNFAPSQADAVRYKNFVLTFDIFCNPTDWILDDYLLRPYSIMHELDKMFNLSKLNSSGPINFIGADAIIINENLMGFSLSYLIYDYR